MNATTAISPDAKHDDDVLTTVQAIKTETQKLDANDGAAIASIWRIGQLLLALKLVAKRMWTKQRKSLGYSERIARRYISIGTSPLAQSGLNEFDLLARLPTDLGKLEWICRLDVEQLRTLLRKMNPKRTSREKIAAEVKAILAIHDEEAPIDFAKTVKRVFKRMQNVVTRVQTEITAEEEQRCIEQLLREELEQVAQALTVKPATTSPAAFGTNDTK